MLSTCELNVVLLIKFSSYKANVPRVHERATVIKAWKCDIAPFCTAIVRLLSYEMNFKRGNITGRMPPSLNAHYVRNEKRNISYLGHGSAISIVLNFKSLSHLLLFLLMGYFFNVYFLLFVYLKWVYFEKEKIMIVDFILIINYINLLYL